MRRRGAERSPHAHLDQRRFRRGQDIGRLRAEGVDVRRFVLCASRETLLKRLRRRNLGLDPLGREGFAVEHIR